MSAKGITYASMRQTPFGVWNDFAVGSVNYDGQLLQ